MIGLVCELGWFASEVEVQVRWPQWCIDEGDDRGAGSLQPIASDRESGRSGVEIQRRGNIESRERDAAIDHVANSADPGRHLSSIASLQTEATVVADGRDHQPSSLIFIKLDRQFGILGHHLGRAVSWFHHVDGDQIEAHRGESTDFEAVESAERISP